MDIRPLDETLSISPQVTPEDLRSIAAQGYRSVISNRPDGETPDQPSAAEIAAAAKAAGLGFRHIPVVGGAIGEAEVAAFKAALAELPRPILGFCRTGARTTTLWALARKDEQPADPDRDGEGRRPWPGRPQAAPRRTDLMPAPAAREPRS